MTGAGLRLLLLLAAFSAPAAALSSDALPIELSPGLSAYPVTRAQVLIDPDGTLSIENIRALENRDRAPWDTTARFNFGYSNESWGGSLEIASEIGKGTTMKSLVFAGALATFGCLALFLAAVSLFTIRTTAATALALGLFMTTTVLRAENPAFEYRTVMSDKPRLLPRLGANTMSEDERFVLNNIHCGLFETDVTGGIRPELASSWSVEEDGTLYRFKVKDGFKDSGGKRIDAEYVYRSIQKSLELSIVKKVWENPNAAIRGYKEIVGFEKCIPGSCDLPGLRLIGDEIVIHLKRRWPAFLELLVRHMLPIYRSEKSSIGEDIPIGCGAYQVSSYSRSSMTLVNNPHAYQIESLAPDVFTIDFTDPRSAVRGFCANKYYDLIFFAPTRKELSAAGCRDDRIVWREADTAGYWAINMGSRAMFKDPALFSRLYAAVDPAEFRAVWNIESATQTSTIPKIFGGTRTTDQERATVARAQDLPAITRKITVRYIDGTPEPERFALAVDKWMKRAKIEYTLAPTPFTEFCEDLSKGSSAVYISGESPRSKLVNFLAPIFEMNSSHYKGAELTRLKRAWHDFLRDDASPALSELDQMFLSSNRFIPLFVARRPLVFIRGYYIRRHSELGLATLSIHEFRRGRP
jgi:MarR-like DNA-binding transcriptional regulator SgrR of sgrS sRNA